MKAMLRVGGVCGILYCLALIVGFAALMSAGASERDVEVGQPAEYLATMSAGSTSITAALCLFNSAAVLCLVFVLGIYEVLADYGPWRRVALLGAVSSSFLFLTSNLVLHGVVSGIAAQYENADVNSLPIAAALVAIRNHAALWGYLVLGVTALLLGIGVLRTGAVAAWLGWVAILAGILSAVGILAPLAGVFTALHTIGLILFGVWALILGILMLRMAPDEAA